MSWAEFREQISASLDNEELRTLCFDLDVDYDSLRGQGKDDKIRELIALLRRNGRLPELESRLSVLRPLTNWQGILDQIPNHDLLPPSDFVPPVDRSKRDKKRNVLIAFTVVLGLIVVVIVAISAITGGFDDPDDNAKASNPTRTEIEEIADMGISDQNVEETINESCLDQFFANIEADRQISIEVGERSRDFIVASEDTTSTELTEPYGIKLTKNGDMVAALIFTFRAEDVLFKITSVIDADCQTVEGYHNVFRPSSGGTLQDNDPLEIPLEDGTFSLRFNFQGTHIRFSFQER